MLLVSQLAMLKMLTLCPRTCFKPIALIVTHSSLTTATILVLKFPL